jgi:hypothetical protein
MPIINIPADTNASLAGKASLSQAMALKEGAPITDVSGTIQPYTDFVSKYILPVTTLSVNRTTTIGVSGTPPYGFRVVLERQDATAYTWAIVNGGTNGGTIYTFPASPTSPSAIVLFYTGADWISDGLVVLGAGA